MWPEIETDASLQRVYHDIELPTSVVLQKIERNGVLINKDLLNAQSNEIGKRLLELEQNAYELAEQPFNLNSPNNSVRFSLANWACPSSKNTLRCAVDG
jgi:DNA polymerase-1